MKIYLAGSWKNESNLLRIACELRESGHEVDLFCDPSTGRYVFNFKELGDASIQSGINQIQAQTNQKIRRAFEEDRRWIEWSDALVLVLSSGRSAHLEAGYSKGIGKKLFIFGDFPNGQLDVMYGFADGIFDNIDDLKKTLSRSAL
jgi:hypothetical protein